MARIAGISQQAVALSAAEIAVLDSVTAGTAAASKALVLDSAKGITAFRLTSSGVPYLIAQPAQTAKTTSTTLTAAELISGIITGVGAAAVAYTLPLATDLETALIALFPGLANNDAFEFSVINIDTTGANTITVTTNTGWTLVGDMVLAGNAAGDESSGTFRARRTSATTYTLYRI